VPAELIEDLPLQYAGSPRNPGIRDVGAGFSGKNENSPTDQGGFKLNGGQQAGTDILVDGATIELASRQLADELRSQRRGVQEFKVMTNTFDAGYGRMSGGLVNWSPSGNQWLAWRRVHILKNRVLDANSWASDYPNPPRRSQSTRKTTSAPLSPAPFTFPSSIMGAKDLLHVQL